MPNSVCPTATPVAICRRPPPADSPTAALAAIVPVHSTYRLRPFFATQPNSPWLISFWKAPISMPLAVYTQLAVMKLIAVPAGVSDTSCPVVYVAVASTYSYTPPSSVFTAVPRANRAVSPVALRFAPIRLETTVWFAIFFLLSDQHAAELGSAGGHVARPADQLHDSVLVNRLALAANWHEVAIPVRPEKDVVGIERPHMRGSRTAGSTGSVYRAVDARTHHHISSHASAVELQRWEPGPGSTATIRAGNALDSLQRVHVELEVGCIGYPQVWFVASANERQRKRSHVLLDIRRAYRRAAIRCSAVALRLPERPRCTVDPAVGSASRRVRYGKREADDVFTAVPGAVLIAVIVDAVSQLRFRDFHAAFHQVDNLLFAAVLQRFEAGHRDGTCVLLDIERSRANRAVLSDVDRFVTAVGIGRDA